MILTQIRLSEIIVIQILLLLFSSWTKLAGSLWRLVWRYSESQGIEQEIVQ